MDLFGSGNSTMVSFLLFLIIFPLRIVAEVVDRPIWNEAKWAEELENDRKKHSPDVKSGSDGPISELIECALNDPKKFPPCSDTIRTALLNEILLRKQFKSHNEDCNSPGTEEGDLILNPPKWQDGLVYPLYSEWQEKVINSKLQFCDPHKYLRCSAEKKCVCVAGTDWSPPNEMSTGRHKNICVFSHLKHCTGYHVVFDEVPFPTAGQWFFDPFKTSGAEVERTVQRPFPRCGEQKDTCQGDFYSIYIKELSYCYNGDDRMEGSIGSQYGRIHDYVNNFQPPLLKFNEQCNFRDHNRFFTSTKEEDESLEVRLKNLGNFVSRGTMFCDLKKFLTCGPSEKCECMSPSSRKDDKCVVPDQLDKCQIDPTMEPILMNKTLVRRAREELMIGFASAVTVKACEGKLTCHSERMEMYCTCPQGKTGQECEETLTKFLSIVRVPSLPTDVAGYLEKVKEFSKFNQKALLFEEVFKLGDGAICTWETQNKAEMLVGRIQMLKNPGTVMTKDEYKKLTDSIVAFTTDPKSQGICKDTLRCQYSTKMCVRQTRENYLLDLKQELEKSKTLKCNEMGCSAFPMHMDGVMFGGDETNFYGEDHEVDYNKILQHSKLLESKARFCSGGGSCTGRVPGTCDCQLSENGIIHYSTL